MRIAQGGRAEICAFFTVLCWTDAFCKVAEAIKGACVRSNTGF